MKKKKYVREMRKMIGISGFFLSFRAKPDWLSFHSFLNYIEFLTSLLSRNSRVYTVRFPLTFVARTANRFVEQ